METQTEQNDCALVMTILYFMNMNQYQPSAQVVLGQLRQFKSQTGVHVTKQTVVTSPGLYRP
jgi:hypothetical protein